MEQTANYGLNQWDAGDRILMEDFNADNAKVDQALMENAGLAASASRLYFGTYEGDQQASKDIELGFTPKIVLLCTAYGMFYSNTGGRYGGIASADVPCTSGTGVPIFCVIENGFRVFYDNDGKIYSNSNHTYHYIAVK